MNSNCTRQVIALSVKSEQDLLAVYVDHGRKFSEFVYLTSRSSWRHYAAA